MTVQQLINILAEFDPCYDIKIYSDTRETNITHFEIGDNDYEIVIWHE